MTIALTILLIAFCIQGLVEVRRRIPCAVSARASSGSRPTTKRDGHIISVYDSVDPRRSSWCSSFCSSSQTCTSSASSRGLIVGMLLIQIFFHRFSRPLGPDQAPQPPTPPRKLMSYAIQANPGLAWLEIALMTRLFAWALFALIRRRSVPR